MIKYENEIVMEIKERGQIQVPNGCVTGEKFEKLLRDKNINIAREKYFSNSIEENIHKK